MASDASFLVEDFLDAITSQLDRSQDALRLKAVNRPLTYAIKDFTLELKVFVEVDAENNVRVRSSGPNETGASTMNISFTTVTRPMIEESTVTLAATGTPTLAELGLDAGERMRLERLGVRNAAELRNLGRSAGLNGVARVARIDRGRVLGALAQTGPQVDAVLVEPPDVPAASPPADPPVADPPPAADPPPDLDRGRGPRSREDLDVLDRKRDRARFELTPEREVIAEVRPIVRVPADTRRMRLAGDNLLADAEPPKVMLGARELPVRHADQEKIVFDLPADVRGGALSVQLGDQRLDYELQVAGDRAAANGDPWSPGAG